MFRFLLSYFLIVCCCFQQGWGDPVISEFLAANNSELADEDGEFSDWIEIHNPDAVAVNMSGWHLTDSESNLDKWTFPSVSIPSGGYLVVFASNKDRATAGSELHTDFKLSSGGEYLALVKPDGVTKTTEFNPFPSQNEDVSYGVNSSIVLLGQNASLRYSLSAPAGSWTQHDFDHSAWEGTRNSGVGVLITECETGSPDEVEIQNVSGNPVNTTGWYMAFGEGANGNINGTEEFLAFLPNALPAGGVHLFTENNAGLGNIGWANSGTRGWAMLLNASDEVMDFVVWGYSEAEVRSLNINQNISGKQVQVSYADIPWSGTPASSGNSSSNKIMRSGSRDTDTVADWSFTNSATLGSQNSTLALPFTSYGQTQAQAGIGYEKSSGYQNLLLTHIDSETSQVWVRFPFNVTSPAEIGSLTLRLRYDDGFQAYVNGVAVANANDLGTVGVESDGFVDFNLNPYLSALRTGENVLAIRLLNESSSSSDLLLMPELVASLSTGLSSYTYLTEPSPGVANQGGVLNPGPVISEVTENPATLSGTDALLVSAHVQPREVAVGSVTLRYRVNYGSEVDLAMNDSGAGGDAVAGDGVYSATIPASASAAGDMLRWTVLAVDSGGLESRMPLQADSTGNSQSPEYYGTVISSIISGQLPVMQWFTQDEAASRTRTGTRASVFYEGRFYDNIFVRQRGGYTNNGSQKFDFNKGFPLTVNADLPSVGEVNMNANGSDSSYVRQTMGFDLHRVSGGAGCESFPVNMQLNGSFDRVGILIEQVDEDYLERFGYDRDGGELFKFVQRSNLNPALDDVTTGAEKKTGDEADLTSLQSLVNDLKQGTSDARITSFYDNVDVQQFINYMAVRCVQQQADDVRKNFYMYKDTAGDGRWRLFPWDLDWIFGIVGGHGSDRVEHPFFGTQAFPTNDGANQWNRLYDVAFEDEDMQRLYLRRVRTLMDQYMMPTASGSWFETRVDDLFGSMADLSGPSSSNYTSLRNTEIPERRGDLYTQLTASISGMNVVIPDAQSGNPNIVIDEVDFNPASGDQDQEYIRLMNHENTEIDISGWSIATGVDFTFPSGTVIPRNGTLYVSPKLKKFVARTESPTGGEKRLVTGPYAGHLSSFGEDLVLKNEAGGTVHTYNYSGAPSDAQRYLVISEFHYAPLVNQDAEFIEIWNTSTSVTVDLTGVHFSAGVEFDFSGSAVTSLSPGQRVLVVKNQAAFEAAYGQSLSAWIAGEFTDGTSLNNGGERIKLEDATNSTILEFTYDNTSPWPNAPGASLTFDYGFGFEPSPIPDPADPSSWDVTQGGESSPLGYGPLFEYWLAARGQSDPLAVVDGWPELMTYALGRDLLGDSFVYDTGIEALEFDDEAGFTVVVGADPQDADDYLTLETKLRICLDVTVEVEISTNMAQWQGVTDLGVIYDEMDNDRTRSVKYAVAGPLEADQQLFVRLRVRKLE